MVYMGNVRAVSYLKGGSGGLNRGYTFRPPRITVSIHPAPKE